MLKKAGIVVATTAAGLLAVSPLAFAGDDEGHKSESEIENVNEASESNEGLVSGNNISVPVTVCDTVDVEDVADLTGVLGLGVLGSGVGEAEADDNVNFDSCEVDAESGDETDQENEDD